MAIESVQQLLQHYPRRHLDFSDTKTLSQVREGDEITVIAEVRRVTCRPAAAGRMPLKVTIYDGTSHLSLTFFNQPWRANQLKPGTRIAAKGKVTSFRGARQMNNALVDVLTGVGRGG